METTAKKLEKTIMINVPAARIFAYLVEPTNLLEIWPSLIDVRDIIRLPNGGCRFRWVFKMIGTHLKGTCKTSEFIPDRKAVFKSRGGIESTISWMLQSEAGGTKVTFETDCSVPARLSDKVTATFIARGCQREADLILANLKDRLEG